MFKHATQNITTTKAESATHNGYLTSILNIVAKPYRLDRLLFVALVMLALANILIQYSAGNRDMHHLIADIGYLLIGFMVFFSVIHLNMTHLKAIAKPLYALTICLLVTVLLVGTSHHGAKRWLHVGIQLQPSELAKIATLLVVAYYFFARQQNAHTIKNSSFVIALMLILLPFLLIAKQPDLGTASLVLLAGFWVLFFAGLPSKLMVLSLSAFIVLAPFTWHFLHPYQQHRLITLMNPTADPLGKGYHVLQGEIAIGSGGFLGKGYLQGTQTHLDFIPEKDTDFVITVLAEEFGFVGVILLTLIYAVIIWRGLKITSEAKEVFSQSLAGGITMSLLGYVAINMGMVAGIVPAVGVPLPLISYGGSSTIVLMISLGVLFAIKNTNAFHDSVILN